MASILTKECLNPIFYRACYSLDCFTVTELFRLGGDPFWTNSEGITCIINAALSPIEARKKLLVLQSELVSTGSDILDLIEKP